MTTDMIIGVVAGAGWGTLIGFVLGARWLWSIFAESSDGGPGGDE